MSEPKSVREAVEDAIEMLEPLMLEAVARGNQALVNVYHNQFSRLRTMLAEPLQEDLGTVIERLCSHERHNLIVQTNGQGSRFQATSDQRDDPIESTWHPTAEAAIRELAEKVFGERECDLCEKMFSPQPEDGSICSNCFHEKIDSED